MESRLVGAIKAADALRFPTGSTERDLVASKSPTGCCMTILIPCVIASYFAYQYVQNAAAPNVSTMVLTDLSTLPPVSITFSCVPGTPLGPDPACPSLDFPAAAVGF